MNKQDIKDNAPHGATHYMIYDGVLYFFKKIGVHMHQYLTGYFNDNPFSCSTFYKFKPL